MRDHGPTGIDNLDEKTETQTYLYLGTDIEPPGRSPIATCC